MQIVSISRIEPRRVRGRLERGDDTGQFVPVGAADRAAFLLRLLCDYFVYDNIPATKVARSVNPICS
jgi:hypothetical protein